ncbi:MAG: hypothetical protein JNK15_17120 [Planctomycetes bacterium]|nr:hypothetical protein [Planctomycetota bacterium]
MAIHRFLRCLPTAVALLVVVAFVMTLLMPSKVGSFEPTSQVARSKLQTLGNQSRLLIAIHGREPMFVDRLVELLQMWPDRWGAEIRAEWNEREIVLTSAGPDGRFDTEDDIATSR